MSAGGGAFGRPPPSHHPPTRDAQSIKYVLYGPGHEKFPSWPMAAAAEVPVAIRAPPTGSSQRSKSWTDHTTYPKEQIVSYTRPYMKRNNPSYPLKTVLERCEQKSLESRQYMQNMDRRMANNSMSYNNQPHPERDEQQKREVPKMGFRAFSKESIAPLTQADLEEYTKKFDESAHIQHQKQSSYAQSEGYHSYVSSSDSSSTPFMDSLRRDIDASVACISRVSSWDGESIVTTRSGSVSSSETLKWHGSLSDMSDVSNSSGTSPRQLIVHSARVQTPQKQNSESVLYMARTGTLPDRPLPHRTISYTLPNHRVIQKHSNDNYQSPVPPRKTVAECINIYEGGSIKAIQKKALLSFYERQQDQMKKDIKSTEIPMDSHINTQHGNNELLLPKRHHENHMKSPTFTCDSPNSIFQGPVIMGPSISLDEWVPERPPKNRNLMMGHINQEPRLMKSEACKPRRVPSPELPLPSPPLPASDDDIMYKCDDPFPPPPEKIKESYHQFSMRSSDGYAPQCEPQVRSLSRMNDNAEMVPPPQMVHDVSTQPYIKTAIGLPRNYNSSYLKSNFYGYDTQQKIEKVPLKLSTNNSLNMEDGEMIHNNKRQDSFNKLPPHNRPETQGHFRAEPVLLSKLDKESQSFNFKKEIVGSPHQKSLDAVGHFRAEPLTVQPNYFVQNQPNMMVNEAKKGIAPKPVPKIHRSNSESNHNPNARDMPLRPSLGCNNFSKSSIQNQSMKRFYNPEMIRKNPHFYGRQESVPLTAMRCESLPYRNNFARSKCDKSSLEDIPTKEEKPPLPEKKCFAKVADIQKINQVSVQKINQASMQTVQIEPELFPTPHVEQSEALPKKLDTDIECNEITKCIEDLETENISNHDVSTENKKASSDMVEQLQTRKHLSEEKKWESMRLMLIQCLPTDHQLQALLSEYADCNNTAQHIVDNFEYDANDLEEEKNEKIKTVEDMKSSDEVAGSKLNENLMEIFEWNLKSDKLKVEECLQALIKALEDQASVLEINMNTNEELGASVVAALEKPYSTRVSRLMTDIGLITSLISSLLSRFNRICKNIRDTESDQQHKSLLEVEKGRLMEKLEDARALKKNIDNNRTKLLSILETELKDDLMHNYKYFIGQKIKLVIHMRDVKDRIDLAKRLMGNINQEQYYPAY